MYNGEVGILVGWDQQNQRWKVRFPDVSEQTIGMKGENLQSIDGEKGVMVEQQMEDMHSHGRL